MGTKPDGSPDRRHVKRKTESSRNAGVRSLEKARDAGLTTKPGRKPTVREMLTRHINVTLVSRGRAPHTIRSYMSLCEHQIFPRWGAQRIDRLRDEQIEEGYAEMLAAGLAKSSVVKVHAILSSAYELAVSRGLALRNPCCTVEPPELGEPAREGITQKQAVALVGAIRHRRNWARWAIALVCGLRQGEALGLRWSYAEVEENEGGTLRIWHQLQRLPWQHGCEDITACTGSKHKHACPKRCPKIRASGRPHTCIPAGAKNLCKPGCQGHAAQCPGRHGGGLVWREIKEKRRKVAVVGPAMARILAEHRRDQGAEQRLAGEIWEDHGLIFCQPDGRPIDSKADWQEWQEILAEAGLEKAGVHAARHTSATVALNEDIALAVTQEILGHSDIRVTRGYQYVSGPLRIDAAARMEAALLGA
jgi:integrase